MTKMTDAGDNCVFILLCESIFFDDDIYQVGHSLIYMLHKMQADDEMENI